MKNEQIKFRKSAIRVDPDNRFRYFNINDSTGNCKLSYVENLGNCLASKPEVTIQQLKNNLKCAVFFVHLTRQKYIDILDEHFECIYCNKVPIGYLSSKESFQYHALYFKDGMGVGKYKTRLKKHRKFTDEQIEKIQSYRRKDYLEKYLTKITNPT